MSEISHDRQHSRIRRGRLPNGESRALMLGIKVSRTERSEIVRRAVELTDGNISKLLVSSALAVPSNDTDTRASKEDIDRLTQTLFQYSRQIAAIGNNVNQIAKSVNAGERYDSDSMKMALIKLIDLTNQVRTVIIRERRRGLFQ